MRLHMVPQQILPSSITERRIRGHFTVAHLIITTIANIKINRPVSSGDLITARIAPRVVLTDTAGTEPVHLALLQIDVIGVKTVIKRYAGRSVLALSVGNGFWYGHSLLFREIGYIVGGALGSGRRGLEDGRGRGVGVDEVGVFAEALIRHDFIIFGSFKYTGHIY